MIISVEDLSLTSAILVQSSKGLVTTLSSHTALTASIEMFLSLVSSSFITKHITLFQVRTAPMVTEWCCRTPTDTAWLQQDTIPGNIFFIRSTNSFLLGLL
uniref:Uncharacterized protein n=1 Tax=Cacopsylla melanoneura TaxID=428564 RepID=A0A8D8UYP8_9HEMI